MGSGDDEVQIVNGTVLDTLLSEGGTLLIVIDGGAPDAVYCAVGGGVSLWQIDLQGHGSFSFAVTAAQIEAGFTQATATGVNQAIGSGAAGNTLYALSDGHTLAFFAPDLRQPGKTYQYTFERSLCA